MVKKFVVYRSELQEVGSFLPDRDAYDRVVKYEDYEALKEKADRLAGELDKFLSGERAYLDEAMSQYLAEDEDK